MPVDLLSEAARLATSGLLVAAVAAPAGLVASALRPRGEPLLPRWRPFPVPWGGFEVAVAFLVVSFVIPMLFLQVIEDSRFFQHVYGEGFPRVGAADVPAEDKTTAATVRMLWAGLFALPVQLGGLALVRAALYPKWRPRASGSVAGKVALAVAACAALAPAVILLNAATNALAIELGVEPDTHSLAKLGGRPLLDQILLTLEACVGAPLREEILIRGLMLWWCVGRMRGLGVSPPPAWRPWLVLAAGALLAALNGKWQPVAFAAVLAVGLAVLWRVKRTGARRARAVYATAAFFALLHPVWPNPIPLFALGLGLGYLAVRTNGLLVPVLVHGLFNAVSVAFVLRGG